MQQVKFYKDKKGEYRWRIVARNGKIVADCGEGYKRIAGATKGFIAMVNAAIEYILGEEKCQQKHHQRRK